MDESKSFTSFFKKEWKTSRNCRQYKGESEKEEDYGTFLNIGIIRMPVSPDTAENLKYRKAYGNADERCASSGADFGVECIASMTPEPIPVKLTTFFGALAKKYGVYLVPGTICESSAELPKGKYYNTAPIFNPKGELIDCYRKMVPRMPVENNIAPGNRRNTGIVSDRPPDSYCAGNRVSGGKNNETREHLILEQEKAAANQSRVENIGTLMNNRKDIAEVLSYKQYL